jgi:NAD(P)-dependent dehydrogenase (short-subunit alcohol dehydrogenase family)
MVPLILRVEPYRMAGNSNGPCFTPFGTFLTLRMHRSYSSNGPRQTQGNMMSNNRRTEPYGRSGIRVNMALAQADSVAHRSQHPSSLAAIVTGGAGEGIGHGITEALVAEGWAVLIVDRDGDRARHLQDRIRTSGGILEVLEADITAPETPVLAVQTALQSFGRLSGLVNNAGVGLCKPLAEVGDEEFETILDVDLRATFRFCRAAIPEMLSTGGSIVNIGSVHAHKTIRGYGLYGCVKSALEGLTRGVAVDYGRHGVRANCVHPGLVNSEQNRELIRAFNPDPDGWLSRYTETKQLIPSLVTSQQVGNLVAWLLGPKSATMTAQAITLDGGSSVMLFEREPLQ